MMDMDRLMARLTAKEGSYPFPYDDATGLPLKPGMTLKGNLTIGRGRNLTAKGISDAESKYLERNDINDALAASERQAWWPAVRDDDVRARAMVEVVFNMGIQKLQAKFPRMLAALQRRDFNGTASEYLDSHVPAEIGPRAYEIAAMLRSGEDNQPD